MIALSLILLVEFVIVLLLIFL